MASPLPSQRSAFAPLLPQNNVEGVGLRQGHILIRMAKWSTDDELMEFLCQLRVEIDHAIDRCMTAEPEYLVMGMSAETFYGGWEGNLEFRAHIEDRTNLRVATGAEACKWAPPPPPAAIPPAHVVVPSALDEATGPAAPPARPPRAVGPRCAGTHSTNPNPNPNRGVQVRTREVWREAHRVRDAVHAGDGQAGRRLLRGDRLRVQARVRLQVRRRRRDRTRDRGDVRGGAAGGRRRRHRRHRAVRHQPLLCGRRRPDGAAAGQAHHPDQRGDPLVRLTRRPPPSTVAREAAAHGASASLDRSVRCALSVLAPAHPTGAIAVCRFALRENGIETKLEGCSRLCREF